MAKIQLTSDKNSRNPSFYPMCSVPPPPSSLLSLQTGGRRLPAQGGRARRPERGAGLGADGRHAPLKSKTMSTFPAPRPEQARYPFSLLSLHAGGRRPPARRIAGRGRVTGRGWGRTAATRRSNPRRGRLSLLLGPSRHATPSPPTDRTLDPIHFETVCRCSDCPCALMFSFSDLFPSCKAVLQRNTRLCVPQEQAALCLGTQGHFYNLTCKFSLPYMCLSLDRLIMLNVCYETVLDLCHEVIIST
ncbi:hypothetical protein U9M48_036689 [Paspalum notatum var. saurae]|uniref:Uncharacterized protein n=1 Tax=Paspalum notatum var. saurae TaxID=547442 RepID=A0AAQ3UHQ4_PASNO